MVEEEAGLSERFGPNIEDIPRMRTTRRGETRT